jgi:DNA (cytosine-5)-methyltransferase 1
MREGKDGGGKGPLLSEDMSLTMGTSPTQTLFDGPSVRRLTPTECERLMGWPDGWTIVEGWSSRSTRSAADPTTTKPKPDTSSPEAA